MVYPPQSPDGDSPLLRGATPIHPLAGGPVAGHGLAP